MHRLSDFLPPCYNPWVSVATHKCTGALQDFRAAGPAIAGRRAVIQLLKRRFRTGSAVLQGSWVFRELMSLSAQKASQIHLHLPPVNAPALIVRFSQELQLPQVLASHISDHVSCQPSLSMVDGDALHHGCCSRSSCETIL